MNVACCFCGETVEDPGAIGTFAIAVSRSEEEVGLTFWAHEKCLRAALHADVSNFPSLAAFADAIDQIREIDERDSPSPDRD